MGLLSYFRRHAETPPQGAAATEPADAVQSARTRARRRLIGAVVLVGVGVIGFPLVFETQPRPISVDIPIDIPRKDGAPPLVMPQARAPATPAPAAPPAPAATSRDDVITEAREEPAQAASASLPKRSAVADASATAPRVADLKAPASAAADGVRAKALLEGKPPAAAAPGARYVVQVGAFADAGAARETRQKVENLGLKTYTQVAETASGTRTRVRVGPFATREEADKAQVRARAAGVTAVVLTL